MKRDGTKFLIAWNPTAPVIQNAKDANLVIWDSSREAWDGSKDPLYMPLTQAQLRSGNVTYTSFSFTEKVKFRLDTVGKSGDAASESMVSVSPLSIANPASPSTLPDPAARIGAPPTRTTAENLPPYEPRHSYRPFLPHSDPISPRTGQEKIRPAAIRPRRPASSTESVMPDPPNIVVEVVPRTGFQPGAFHQTLRPPRPARRPAKRG